MCQLSSRKRKRRACAKDLIRNPDLIPKELKVKPVENGAYAVRCKFCTDKFKTVFELERHVVKHQNAVKPFTCSKCNQQFKSSFYAQKHKKDDHPGEEVMIAFNRTPELTKLLEEAFVQIEEPTEEDFKVNVCNICGLEFDSPEILRDHIPKHYEKPKKPSICFMCDISFSTCM